MSMRRVAIQTNTPGLAHSASGKSPTDLRTRCFMNPLDEKDPTASVPQLRSLVGRNSYLTGARMHDFRKAESACRRGESGKVGVLGLAPVEFRSRP